MQAWKKLGYQIENFWLREPGMTNSRASRILFQRGVQGLVIPCQPVPRIHLRMDWDKFAVVVERPAVAYPRFHYVNSDQYQSVRLAFHHLRHLGYKRPGLAIDRLSDRLSLNAWRAGCAIEMETYHSLAGITPVFFLSNNKLNRSALRKWIAKYKVDVVLGSGNILDMLTQADYSVPKDLGCISLDLKLTDGAVAGIDSNGEMEGIHAVNLIHLAIQTGTYGIPQLVYGMSFEGSWVHGNTLKSKILRDSAS
jgi:LacI family transcriptional regulator